MAPAPATEDPVVDDEQPVRVVTLLDQAQPWPMFSQACPLPMVEFVGSFRKVAAGVQGDPEQRLLREVFAYRAANTRPRGRGN